MMRAMVKRAAVIGAVLAAASLPAFAQVQDQKPKRIKEADIEAIKEGIRAIKAPGECMVTYTVGKDGKPKNIAADCTPAEYAPYAVRATEAIEWLPEIIDGETFEIDDVKQPFKFGVAAPPVDPGTPPKIVKAIDAREVQRAVNKVNEAGECKVVMTVGLDGKASDIQPNCTPDKYNKPIGDAVKKMQFEPGVKNGAPIVWPNFEMPLKLTK